MESTVFAGAEPGVEILSKNWSWSRSEVFSFHRSPVIAFN